VSAFAGLVVEALAMVVIRRQDSQYEAWSVQILDKDYKSNGNKRTNYCADKVGHSLLSIYKPNSVGRLRP
jgi:hypothetical protein